MKKTFLVFMLTVLSVSIALGQLSITSTSTYTIDFDNSVSGVNNGGFDTTAGASYIDSNPASGQLDADAWSCSQASGSSASFPGSGTAIYATCTSDSPGTSGGLFAYNISTLTNRMIGFSPTSSLFTPGNITLKIVNNTGSTITQLSVEYLVYAYNNQPRANTVDFWYSSDNTTYTNGNLTFTSTAASTNNWESATKTITITGLTIADNSPYYLQWRLDDSSGSSSRDKFALDNIKVTATTGGNTPNISVDPSTLSGFGYIEGSGSSGEQSFALTGSNLTANLVVSAPTNYEIAGTSGGTFGSSLSYTPSGGSISTTVYVRMKAGLTAGSYNNEVITCTSSGATTQNVTCNGTVYKTEPTNHVTSFTCGSETSSSITVTWTDAAKVTPDGYIIKGNDVGYSSIADPVDGVTEAWDTLIHTVAQGIQTYTFTGLTENTTYYFKIYPYTNSGTNINYKTDGTVPQATATTDVADWPEDFEPGSKVSYTAGYVTCKMGQWYLDQALLGTDATRDMKFGRQSVRIRYDGTTYGSITSNFLKTNGLGTISFYYARSNFTNDRSSDAPEFVVEYSSNGSNWTQAGNQTSLNNVDELTLFSAQVNQEGSYYVRIRQVAGTNGRRWNVDNLTLTDYEPVNPVELASFTATISAQNYITLTWVTQTETGMRGYYIYRGTDSDFAGAQNVSPLIPSLNSSQMQTYMFEDTEVYETGTYYYWLQTNDLDGTVNYHGPVSVFYNALGDNPTPEIPLATKLHAVYPNPFNPLVFIPFSLAKDNDVSFKIYNSRGQIVKHYELGNKAPGNYRITWDGTDYNGNTLSNGVYQIVMTAGSQVYQTKTTLLK